MQFPERFSNLPEYAFPRLRALLDAHAPGGEVLHMTLGEPRHSFPEWVGETISAHAAEFGRYPPNDGTPALREAIAAWIARRYGVSVSAEKDVMPVNGTREGLFNAILALCPERKARTVPAVLLPNPFYQVYAVGAQAAGAEPVFVAATESNGFLPDFASLDAPTLSRTALVVVCSPSNPQGAVADRGYWARLLDLAERHDFRIIADECYSEVYRGVPPPGILEVAAERGADPERVIAVHSLSKRSNVPGLRSGFLAGGEAAIAALKKLRAYAGAPLPLPVQHVSARLWQDEEHVVASRALYAEKYRDADSIFAGLPGYFPPQGGFFLWLPVDDGEAVALRLWQETGIRVLPGAYLARSVDGANPGAGRIRVAMVAPAADVRAGLRRIRNCIET